MTGPDEGGPRLLAGGNPQVPKGDGDAPVEAYLSAMPGWKEPIGRLVDGLVGELVPDAHKAIRWNSPFYGVEGHGWFLTLHCFTHYVKLTFFNGAELDPPPPETFKDPKARAVHIGETGVEDEALLRTWIQQSGRLPGWSGS